MKAIKWAALWIVMASTAMGAYEYVWVDTNTGVYKPARVQSDISNRVPYWAGYIAVSNIDANHRDLLNVHTGRFEEIWLAGVRLGSTGGAVVVSDTPVSGLTPTPSAFTPTYRTVNSDALHGNGFWYSFTESGTYYADETSGNNSGVGLPTNRAPTVVSYAATLSKISENYIGQSGSTGILSGVSDAAFGLWLKLTSPLTNNNPMLMAGGSSGLFGMWMDSSNVYVTVKSVAASASLTYAHTNELSDGAWHRLIATYKKTGIAGGTGADIALWLDGSVVSSGTEATNFFPVNSRKFLIGNSDGTNMGNAFIDGSMDDVFAISQIPSGLEITNDYSWGRSMSSKEFETLPPAAPILLAPASGASIWTGAVPVNLVWSDSSVATTQRVGLWTNAAYTNSVLTNGFSWVATNILTTNKTYSWSVVSSNAYGTATSLVSTFSAYGGAQSYNTNLYMGMGVYLDAPVNAGATLHDRTSYLGIDDWTVSGTPAAWSNYAMYFNGDGQYNDYMHGSGVSYSNNAGFSVGFFVLGRQSLSSSGDTALFSDTSALGANYSTSISLYRFTDRNPYTDDGIFVYLPFSGVKDGYYFSLLSGMDIEWKFPGYQFLANTWYHIVLTVERTSDISMLNTLYVNGLPVKTSSGTWAGYTAVWYSLKPPYTTKAFGFNTLNGAYDDFFIMDRALTAAEIVAIYANGRSENIQY